MAKIVRFNGNVMAFAIDSQSGEKFLFGSSTTDSDNLTDQLTSEFLRGWATVGASEFPPLEWFNAAMFTSTQFISYLHQMGIAEWNEDQEYPTAGASCVYDGLVWFRADSWTQGDEPRVTNSWYTTQVESRFKGNQNWNVKGKDGEPLPSPTPQDYLTIGNEISAGIVVETAINDLVRDNGLVDATSGSYSRTYGGDVTGDYHAVKLADGSLSTTGVTAVLDGSDTKVIVDFALSGPHKFLQSSEQKGVAPDISDEDSLLYIINDLLLSRTQKDMLSSRVAGVVYTNNEQYPIDVSVALNSTVAASAILTVDGVDFVGSYSPSSGNSMYVTTTIQPGSDYIATVSAGGGTAVGWNELRI